MQKKSEDPGKTEVWSVLAFGASSFRITRAPLASTLRVREFRLDFNDVGATLGHAKTIPASDGMLGRHLGSTNWRGRWNSNVARGAQADQIVGRVFLYCH
ncbi:MAG TPA: hypothetical protein PKA27_17545 [Fimbriimonadaceae bacterium]|nr:hypothetical protein [Fimbriimonadaceae bacterium]